MKDLSSRNLDQFYTNRLLSKKLIEYVKLFVEKDANIRDILWIEPSAGDGAFYDFLPENKFGLDLDPKKSSIKKQDFLTFDIEESGLNFKDKIIITIGNPPFGKNSSLALKFIKKSAEFSDFIAFILPRTFEKDSFKRKINSDFWLVHEEILKEDSFIFEGNTYSVPTVFQIWKKQNNSRVLEKRVMKHEDFDFVSKEDGDFSFQRVGAKAGLVLKDFSHKSPSSHYFIKSNDKKNDLFSIFEQISWEDIKKRTAGNPSIGKSELIERYLEFRYGD